MKDLFNIAVAFLSIPFCLLCQAGSKPVPAKWLHDGRLVVPEFNFSINSPSPDPKWSYKDDSLGPVLVAGPLVAWIVGALEGAAVVGGVSAIGAGLIGIGIPKDSVVQYELAIKTDKFLLMVHGTAPDVEKARSIIASTRPMNVTLHSTEIVGAGV
jgi:hypothetical protein